MSKTIKRDDIVTVISGESAGKSGKVLAVNPRTQRVIVEHVNVGRKTLRPTQQQPQGGLIERERPIHLSNVMLQERYEQRMAKRSATGPAAAASGDED